MSVENYSTDPAQNNMIGTIALGEGQMTVADTNNAIRQLMADIKGLWNSLPDEDAAMPKTGGVFTGDVSRQGAGAFLFHQNNTLLSGRIHVQSLGSPEPGGLAEGDMILEF